ncbi:MULTISPECIES: lipopolysaccharide assembly protein LapA domain-containing protein [unclassified Paenibacillus]|uniref:LapA family protein n=1 Tax=unclassified Paenibacillus TaxID=185978 RepID=UPI000956B41B|nr:MULTISPECIES: lipopolysaccharide assembly protein LapA domain-containing protein [unclassified Paenibacillus]ASS66854.1 DUF1049 domain-containing protein [Paenibacillus sp. RUD330]SIP93367.1 Uncharacterized integral membrane protein [Paenibacillus sp. RU4X]SIQ11902.1 Uncharacterized integral membrane protein [Paenibacillus sp. RU4T]
MKTQGLLISGLVFALLIAIFAVINVDPVRVNFMFATTSAPLILVILISALLGGLSIGLFGIIRQYRLQREIKGLKRELDESRALHSSDRPVIHDRDLLAEHDDGLLKPAE